MYSLQVKSYLKDFSASVLGSPLDGRAGLHVYFLIRALRLLEEDGRLSFIMPADTCEGIFAPVLWSWIARNFRIDAVVTFAPNASPFPDVDTNPIIFMIRKSKTSNHFLWCRCLTSGTTELKNWAMSGMRSKPPNDLKVIQRETKEALVTGLSRSPMQRGTKSDLALADFATALRGIATGANEFFFLTREQASELAIPQEFLRLAIGRTRDVHGDEITTDTIESLASSGRPTLLFSPDGRPIDQFPRSVREYLKRGEALRLNKLPLLSTRKPWYKMETRPAPPILFAYLGRRNARFIRNYAGVVPLTGFLCVYPRVQTLTVPLWGVLRDPSTVTNLGLVGKSYGSGCIKVEPRALEKLPLSRRLIERVGLLPARSPQSTLVNIQAAT